MNRDLIAEVAHAINQAYCLSLGDDSIPDWADAPEWQKQSALMGVDMHLANPEATPAQSHESWLAVKEAEGWQYGPVKDPANKVHPCILPFEDLPTEQKSKDYLFRAVVHALKGVPGPEVIEDLKRSAKAADAQLQAALAELEKQGVSAAINPFDQPVKYIGRRDTFTDNQYNTRLTWQKDQVRYLPGDVARKFLRHRDLFTLGEGESGAPAGAAKVEDDTVEVLQRAEQENTVAIETQTQLAELIDTVNQMTKSSLAEFAANKYNHKFRSVDKLNDMRKDVVNLIHQFGVV